MAGRARGRSMDMRTEKSGKTPPVLIWVQATIEVKVMPAQRTAFLTRPESWKPRFTSWGSGPREADKIVERIAVYGRFFCACPDCARVARPRKTVDAVVHHEPRFGCGRPSLSMAEEKRLASRLVEWTAVKGVG